MCGRYFLADKTSMNLDEVYNVAKVVERAYEIYGPINPKTKGEVYPSDVVPVICLNKNKQVRAFLMRWGFEGYDKGKLIINARSETVLDKPTFSESVLNRRCLVPASFYNEWEGKKGAKTKYFLKPMKEEIFFMAAIYRVDEKSKLPVFTILTRKASPLISFIHDRMPVIVPRERWKDWLNINKNPLGVIENCVEDIEYQTELFD